MSIRPTLLIAVLLAVTAAVTCDAMPADTSGAPAAAGAADAAVQLTREQSDFFESRVRPVLATCYKCHSVEEKNAKGDLVLDSRGGWQQGGKHGPAIVPGDPGNSLLIKAVRYEDPDLQMPPNGDKLGDEQIAALEQWVQMGAPDPRVAAAGGQSTLTGLNDAARRTT